MFQEQSGFVNSPDLYPRAFQEPYLQQLIAGQGREQRTRRNSIDSSHLYYRSRVNSNLRIKPRRLPAVYISITLNAIQPDALVSLGVNVGRMIFYHFFFFSITQSLE